MPTHIDAVSKLISANERDLRLNKTLLHKGYDFITPNLKQRTSQAAKLNADRSLFDPIPVKLRSCKGLRVAGIGNFVSQLWGRESREICKFLAAPFSREPGGFSSPVRKKQERRFGGGFLPHKQ